jgi:hypothetical protein
MTVFKFIIILVTLFFLTSCERSHKLSKTDYAWMPYKGNETVVFTSNNGDTDTIFFLRKDTIIAYPEAQNPFGDTYELVDIFCKHSDPSPPDKKHRYLENSFYSVSNGVLSIGLLAEDAVFYSMRKFRIDSLNKTKPSLLRTKYHNYNDVYVFSGEDYLGFLHDRSNFVTKVYWSKSQGMVRFDKKDSVYWELKNKYSP